MAKILDAEGKPIKCSKERYKGGYYPNACHFNATVFRPASSGDGHYYCTIHDPVRKAEKRAERDRQQREAWAAKDAAYKEQRAAYAKEIVTCHDYDNALTLFDRIRRSRGYY